jgi:Holliday junction resolvase RusA-like endonuclease
MSENDSPWPLKIVIPGTPRGKERPRLGKGRVYTPAKTKEYENTVAWAAKVAMGRRKVIEGPLSLMISCYFKGKSPGYHVSKPDLDNCCKAILDGMEGITFKNDSQIARLILSKENALDERVEVWCEPLPPLPQDK